MVGMEEVIEHLHKKYRIVLEPPNMIILEDRQYLYTGTASKSTAA